jgi:hypothetical protein
VRFLAGFIACCLIATAVLAVSLGVLYLVDRMSELVLQVVALAGIVGAIYGGVRSYDWLSETAQSWLDRRRP